MITLDAVRAALLSDGPAAELDRLIRAEQAAGRRVKDIHAELRPLVEPARDTPGVTDDADDSLMDVLDALTGNCAERWRYKDGPDSPPPAEAEAAGRPSWVNGRPPGQPAVQRTPPADGS